MKPTNQETDRTADSAEEHWRVLAKYAPPTLLVDETDSVLSLSPTVARYLHAPGGSWSSDLTQLVRPELRPTLCSALSRVFAQHRSIVTHPVSLHLDGATRTVSMLVHPRPTQDGSSVALVMFLEDEAPAVAQHDEKDNSITRVDEATQPSQGALRQAHENVGGKIRPDHEREQSIEAKWQAVERDLEADSDEAKQTYDYLPNLLTAMETATLFLDRQLRIKYFTPRAAELFSLSPADKMRPIDDLHAHFVYAHMGEDIHQVLTDLAPVFREVQSQSGRWYWMGMRPYRTLENTIDGIIVTFIDITRRKQIEKELNDLTQRLTIALHMADMVAWEWNPLRDEILVEGHFEEIYGAPVPTGADEEWQLVHPDDRSRYRQAVEDVLKTGGAYHAQFRVVRPDNGRIVWLEEWGFAEPDEEGTVQRVVGVAKDITEHKESELERERLLRELKAERTHLGNVLESISDAFYALNADWCFTYVNRRAEELLGRRRQDLLGKNVFEEFPSMLDSVQQCALQRVMQERTPEHLEFFSSYLNIWIRVNIYAQPNGGLTVYFHDMTERREAQLAEMRQQIIHSQEAERQQLSRELHDGPVQELVALSFEIAALERNLADEYQQTRMAVLRAKLERVIGKLRHVMVTLRPPAVADFGLAAAIERHVTELRQQHPDLSVETALEEIGSLPEEVTLVLYRISQQALYNVITHAEAERAWVRLRLEADRLVLEVEDDGKGFDLPEHWVELTRKRHLGIVGMIERAESIGGRLNVTSSPGQGTLIRVTVPRPTDA